MKKKKWSKSYLIHLYRAWKVDKLVEAMVGLGPGFEFNDQKKIKLLIFK